MTWQVMLLRVSDHKPFCVALTHAKHAARIREASAPAVEKLELPVAAGAAEVAAKAAAAEVAAPVVDKGAPVVLKSKVAPMVEEVAVVASAKASTIVAAEVVAAAEVESAAEVEAAAEVMAAGEVVAAAAAEGVAPVSIAAEKDQDALAKSSADARTLSSSAQMPVAAAVD